MTPTMTAVRAGVSRGLIELRRSFLRGGLVGHLFWPAVILVAISFLRHRSVHASDLTTGALVLPGVPGMFVAFVCCW